MKYEAMKHQGKKRKAEIRLDEVGEAAGESGKTVQTVYLACKAVR